MSVSERAFSSTDRKRWRPFAWLLIGGTAVVAAVILISVYGFDGGPFGKSGSSGANATSEPATGADDDVCLVLDLKKRELIVELNGVALREYVFELSADDQDTVVGRVTPSGSKAPDRIVTNVRLVSAGRVIAQPELSIIAEEAGLNESLIQRYLPAQMVLVCDDGFSIAVESDGTGAETYRWQQVRETFRSLTHRIMGDESISLRLGAQDAMSLYGVALNHPRLIVR